MATLSARLLLWDCLWLGWVAQSHSCETLSKWPSLKAVILSVTVAKSHSCETLCDCGPVSQLWDLLWLWWVAQSHSCETFSDYGSASQLWYCLWLWLSLSAVRPSVTVAQFHSCETVYDCDGWPGLTAVKLSLTMDQPHSCDTVCDCGLASQLWDSLWLWPSFTAVRLSVTVTDGPFSLLWDCLWPWWVVQSHILMQQESAESAAVTQFYTWHLSEVYIALLAFLKKEC